MHSEQDNGILPLIPGQHIGAGSKQLPPPAENQQPEQVAVVDTGSPHGLVRIRYKLMRHKHGKSVNWFWNATHAERVGG